MGGSFSKNDSSSESSSESESGSNFDQNVWGPQGSALTNFWGGLQGMFGDTTSGMQGQIPGATDWMNQIRDQSQPFWQDQMKGGAYQGMNLQGQYNQALGGGGNEQFMNESIMGGAGNDYVDAMKAQMTADSNANLGSNLAMNDLRAAGHGQSGSSRHGMTESGMYKDAQDRLAREQTNLGYNTFDRDLDRKMGIARNADQFDMSKIQNLSGMLNNQQNTMNQGLAGSQGMQNLAMGAFSPYMMPWQGAGAFSGILGNPTILGSGSSYGTSNAYGESDASGMGISGGMGGFG